MKSKKNGRWMGFTLLWKYYEYDAKLPNTRSHFLVKNIGENLVSKIFGIILETGLFSLFQPIFARWFNDVARRNYEINDDGWMKRGNWKEKRAFDYLVDEKEGIQKNTSSKQHKYSWYGLSKEKIAHCWIIPTTYIVQINLEFFRANMTGLGTSCKYIYITGES